MNKVKVFYQAEGIREVQHLEADAGELLESIVARIRSKHAMKEPLLVFAEDAETPSHPSTPIGDYAGKGSAKVHVHHCPHIHVFVAFNGKTVTRDFGPGTTVARVKQWAAVTEFKMTADEAGEHMLQLAGTQDRPAPGTHIGTLASHPTCTVRFDLVPDERVNGHSVCP